MKRNHGYKELNQLQTVLKENKKLKREISSLRKIIARTNIENEQQDQELEEEKTEELPKENSWKCYNCQDGIMQLILYERSGTLFYIRKCSKCFNKTKSKRYHEGVKGIKA